MQHSPKQFDKNHFPNNVMIGQDNLRGQKSLGSPKKSLEMAKKVIAPHKKIMSRSFLNSGTLIVNIGLVCTSTLLISCVVYMCTLYSRVGGRRAIISKVLFSKNS